MGSDRSTATKASSYITREGYQALQRQAGELWGRRREVTKALAAAAAEGDRSENAEYIYRKKELREIDRRIRYLQRRLPDLKVVDSRPADPSRIYFGAMVRLASAAGEELNCRIVGADEIDTGRGWISIDAPLAQALLRRGAGERVSVETPQGIASYRILDVGYAAD